MLNMWKHYCLEEGGIIATEKGCPCNWCGRTEQESQQVLTPAE